MATTTTPRPTQGRPDPGDRRLGRERPIGGGELWLWLFMRISGLLKIFQSFESEEDAINSFTQG